MSRLTEINIKNQGHYYPDDIINVKNLQLVEISVHERPYQNSFIYCVACKTLHGQKPLDISLDKV